MIDKNDFDGNLVYGGNVFNTKANRKNLVVDKIAPQHINYFKVVDGVYVPKEEYFTSLDKCPLCNSENIYYKITRRGICVYECENCKFGFQNPRFKKDKLDELYSKTCTFTEMYENKTQKKLDDIKFKYGLQEIHKYGNTKDSVLDIGSGNLHFLEVCKDVGYKKLYAIEPGSILKDTKSFTVYKDFIDTIPNELCNLSLITMWDTLEHIHDFNKIIRECYRALADNGLLLVIVPNFHSLANRLIRNGAATFGMYHLSYFSEFALEKLLINNKFKILKKETIISEIDNCRNYLEFQEPYMSTPVNDNKFNWLTPEYIHENMLGSRLFFIVQKEYR